MRTGVTFADAAAEYLTYLEVERERKPSTLRDYRSMIRNHFLPAFGEMRLEEITPDVVEAWRRRLGIRP